MLYRRGGSFFLRVRIRRTGWVERILVRWMEILRKYFVFFFGFYVYFRLLIFNIKKKKRGVI